MKKDFFYNWHKDKLQNHDVDVDVDALWAAIEPEVDGINDRRKKRKGFYLFLFGLFFFVLGAGFMGLLMPSLTSDPAHITNTNNTETFANKEGTQIDINNNANLYTTQTTKTSVDNASTNATPKTNSSTLIPSEISSSSKKVSHDDIRRKPSQDRPQNITPKVHLRPERFISETKRVKHNSQNTLLNPTGSNLASANNESEIAVSERLTAMETIPLLSLQNVSSSLASEDLPSQEIELKKKSDFQLSIGLYSGLAFVNRSLSIKNDDDADALLQLRESSEKSLELINQGIKIGVQHKSGFFGSVGFQYARIAERFQFDEDVLKSDSIPNQIIGFSNNLLGQRNPIIGAVPNNTEFELEYDFFNNYHLLEIPLTLGYTKRLSLWSVGVRGSYVQNISLRTKGRILNSSYEVVNITGENDIFKNKLSASFEGAVLTSYRLAPRIELGLEVYYRHIPDSITRSQYVLDQNYDWIGLNTSLSYLF